jgi:hypothetical protein
MTPLPLSESSINRPANRPVIVQRPAQPWCWTISRTITSGHTPVPSFSVLLIARSRARARSPLANDHAPALLHDHHCLPGDHLLMITDEVRVIGSLPYVWPSAAARREFTRKFGDGRPSGAAGDALG